MTKIKIIIDSLSVPNYGGDYFLITHLAHSFGEKIDVTTLDIISFNYSTSSIRCLEDLGSRDLPLCCSLIKTCQSINFQIFLSFSTLAFAHTGNNSDALYYNLRAHISLHIYGYLSRQMPFSATTFYTGKK